MSEHLAQETVEDVLRRENRRLKDELSRRPIPHQTEEEALAGAQAALDRAKKDGHWMVAVWGQSADGKTTYFRGRTTWKFDRGEFHRDKYGVLEKLLHQSLQEEVEPPEPSPLPTAELALPSKNLVIPGGMG